MVKRKTEPTKIPVDFATLSAEDKALLTQEARKSIAAEMEQDARDAYFAAEMARLRQEHVPDEVIVNVTIDLAPYLQNIMIDGTIYYHGYTYAVPRSRAVVFFEQMQRSWQHQDEIDGRGKSEAYRRPSNMRLGPQHAGMPTRGVNGPVNAEI